MLKKLAEKKILITLVLLVFLLVACLLYLIFGGEEKVKLLILTPIVCAAVYAFIRFGFLIVGMHAPQKVMEAFAWFFLIMGTLGALIMVALFIFNFPNGFSPSLGGAIGTVLAVVAEAKSCYRTKK